MVYFGPQFQWFHSVVGWLHCFRPMVRQRHHAGRARWKNHLHVKTSWQQRRVTEGARTKIHRHSQKYAFLGISQSNLVYKQDWPSQVPTQGSKDILSFFPYIMQINLHHFFPLHIVNSTNCIILNWNKYNCSVYII
jgi:hypothetical protein